MSEREKAAQAEALRRSRRDRRYLTPLRLCVGVPTRAPAVRYAISNGLASR
jgi:hypothetical protein